MFFRIKGSKAYLPASTLILIAFLAFQKIPPKKIEKLDPPAPQVLGASVDLRGQAPEQAEVLVKPVLPGPQLKDISAKSFLIYDQENGQILAQKNPDEKLGIASLTKLMTGLLAYQYLNFNDTIVIHKKGLLEISPSVNFIEGDKIKTGDIFDAMIIGSCNDAAQILATEISLKTGKPITQLMNQKALELGMTNTSFSNPIGLDVGNNYSTANDLAKLTDATQNLSAFSNLGLSTDLNFSGSLGYVYKIKNTNHLIAKISNLQAVKTGFTQKSLGSMITKTLNNGHTLVLMVLGSAQRESDTLILKNQVADQLVWR